MLPLLTPALPNRKATKDSFPPSNYGPVPSMRSLQSGVRDVAQVKDSIRQFFEHDVPLKAAADVHRLFGAEGSIAFKVGERGWTFRFGKLRPIDRSFDRHARLQLWFTESAFADLVAGVLDVAGAIGRGEIKAKGDIRLFESFGKFLQTEAATLGWDAGT